MFKNPFSFEGRIRRIEFGLSFIIAALAIKTVDEILTTSINVKAIILIAYIPLYWFLWAQGAKLCHDIGKNGWWQIIPFYVLWMLFQNGQRNANQYGPNPRHLQKTNLMDISIPPDGSQGTHNNGEADNQGKGLLRNEPNPD